MSVKPRDVMLITGAIVGVLVVILAVYLWHESGRKAEAFARIGASAPQGGTAPPPTTPEEIAVAREGSELARHETESSDKTARINGINNLALLPPEPANVQTLENLAGNDPEPSVREAAFRALGTLGLGQEAVYLAGLARGGSDASGAEAGLVLQGKQVDVGPILSVALRDPAIARNALSAASQLRESATDYRRIFIEGLYQPDPATSIDAVARIRALPPEEKAFFVGDLANVESTGPEEVRGMAGAAAREAAAITGSGL